LVDVTEKFDVILINQIFHVVGANEAKEMLRQTRSRLLPGGRVFVQEIVRQAGDAASALFGFNMRLLFENGTVFDADELTRMVENADFVDVRVHPIDGPTSGLVYVTGRVAAEQGG
jgi:cyclopropane fatty-acyl-phospholipid synthase-like methyltransferase